MNTTTRDQYNQMLHQSIANAFKAAAALGGKITIAYEPAPSVPQTEAAPVYAARYATPKPIEELKLFRHEKRIHGILRHQGPITTIPELCSQTEKQLLFIPGMGPMFVELVKDALDEIKLSLAG